MDETLRVAVAIVRLVKQELSIIKLLMSVCVSVLPQEAFPVMVMFR